MDENWVGQQQPWSAVDTICGCDAAVFGFELVCRDASVSRRIRVVVVGSRTYIKSRMELRWEQHIRLQEVMLEYCQYCTS